ncbi:DUF4124 domain-containing protein [Rheinheimera sp. MMS21-TC3]|uniref:DUF4124 domain-containing protein n=1 Tax=Rheinheimera sp. MMS21-TC3 TaxID=3072790 RepID=UPI0028C3B2B5|nr:DUF4124 domain-containing protein [Rheinheimera sp. MMS21-TC3]WNO59500.1 DUF4124 domain-containing protein [Rheinheimera sp. MMS21-TC3]
MKLILHCTFLLSCMFLSASLQASVYKCTDDEGKVVFQGEPCREAEELLLDLRFAEQKTSDTVDKLITGSWCEVGTSQQLASTLQRDSALRKTWLFTEREMVQHIEQGQHSDTFKYPIRQQPGSFVINHVAYGNGAVNWHVKTLTEDRLVIAAYGSFTHLAAGDCDTVIASSN